jgi:hypothetical protein
MIACIGAVTARMAAMMEKSFGAALVAKYLATNGQSAY